MLRKALADAQSLGELPPPSDCLKVEYLYWGNAINDVIDADGGRFAQWLPLIGYRQRLRRYRNLVFANLLSQADRPRFRRRPAPGSRWGLFEADPTAAADPKVLSAKEIESRVLRGPGPDAELLDLLVLNRNALDVFDNDTLCQAELILGLALQLHYREHGQFPRTLSELVQKGYLKSIPADPFGNGEPLHYRREADPRQARRSGAFGGTGPTKRGKSMPSPTRGMVRATKSSELPLLGGMMDGRRNERRRAIDGIRRHFLGVDRA